jgi:hypothetical protein
MGCRDIDEMNERMNLKRFNPYETKLLGNIKVEFSLIDRFACCHRILEGGLECSRTDFK